MEYKVLDTVGPFVVAGFNAIGESGVDVPARRIAFKEAVEKALVVAGYEPLDPDPLAPGTS